MSRETGSSGGRRALLVIIIALFLAGISYSGYLFYVTIRDTVAYAQIPVLQRPPLASKYSVPTVSADGSEGGEEQADPQPIPRIERQERVNVLLLGIDERDLQNGPWRTDTMIVLTVDPATKTAGMLSIPRDLWVPIPSFGEHRINTAHFLGDLNEYPGGGVALAKKTVQLNFGIPIHYYVRVNFAGFKKVVDTIGGIDVEVPEEINDPRYPDGDFGYEPFHISAGHHHMDGELALKYARTRHRGSDFDRIKRQQQVIMAVRDRVMRLGLLPRMLPRLPQLAKSMGDAIQTDMPLNEIWALGQLIREIDRDHIKARTIDQTMTRPITTPQGQQVLWPDREKIRPL
ncbi:MAG: LCP family protein, partial [Candidatus Hadarchaeota archaeon]|nr:LCP family protein [Candidatus Hadarchaeota archaeon]